MANTIDWGEASVNNTNGYGKGRINNTIRWGKIYDSSASGDTNIGTATTPSFSNTKSIALDGVDDFVEVFKRVMEGDYCGSFNIGKPNEISIGELALKIKKKSPRS